MGFFDLNRENIIEFNPINLNNGILEIHPYRISEAERDKEVVNDLFEIFGDISQIPFNKEKLVKDKKDMNTYSIVSDYHSKRQYTHFVSHIESKKIIGKIIISPPVKEYIQFDGTLKNTWIIEFYLNKRFWNKGIMSGIIPEVVRGIQKQGIKKVGAVVDKLNFGSIRVLEKSGLKRIKQFDDLKDLFVSS